MVAELYTEISDREMRALCEGRVREKEKDTETSGTPVSAIGLQPYTIEREISMLCRSIEKLLEL